MAQGDPYTKAARLLAGAHRVVVFTGAGVSKESGIPTYEETLQGRWAEFDPAFLNSAATFSRDPELVWGYYQDLLVRYGGVKPNAAHEAIRELETLVDKVVVVTQNIDGLHQQAGSTDVVELHGSFRRYRCAGGRHTGMTYEELVHEDDTPVPKCPRCGEVARPEVVYFGEMLPAGAIERAFAEARACGAMLVVGTRGKVQPAASVPLEAADAGAPIIEVNVKPGAVTRHARIFFEGAAADIVPKIMANLRALE